MAASDDEKGRLAEFRLIDRLSGHMQVKRDDVALGIGDDAALINFSTHGENLQLVVATDTLVEGTHFLPAAPPASIGHRALAVNLSDFAAMGATPAWASLSISLPEINTQWVDEFAAGFAALAAQDQVQLIGGDTVRGPLSVTVTLQGTVPAGQAVQRNGAQTDDLIFVTGMPGASASGRQLLSHSSETDNESRQELVNKFLYPQPRVAFGRELLGRANAMIDISDGLQADLLHILEQSDCGANLVLDELRLAAAVAPWFDAEKALEFALCGGEDYELLFTVSREHEADVLSLGIEHGCELTQLGKVTSSGVVWSYNDTVLTGTDKTYRHFSG
jgi:thiamine-monophosphate kinase